MTLFESATERKELIILFSLQSFVSKFKSAEQSSGQKKSQNVLLLLLYDQFDPHEKSKWVSAVDDIDRCSTDLWRIVRYCKYV